LQHAPTRSRNPPRNRRTLTQTPDTFITRWHGVILNERSAAQSHFNDLCALIGVEGPVAGEPENHWFTFEKGARKTTVAKGRADLWRKGCFRSGYDARPARLVHAHAALNAAVAESCGRGDDHRAGLPTDDEILARLFALNRKRAKPGV
jgi:hypothetical protein